MCLSFYNILHYIDMETSAIAIASRDPRGNTSVDTLMSLMSQELTCDHWETTAVLVSQSWNHPSVTICPSTNGNRASFLLLFDPISIFFAHVLSLESGSHAGSSYKGMEEFEFSLLYWGNRT